MGALTARTVFLFGTWTLQPDQEPDAEPITYAMQCAVCEESSAVVEDLTHAQGWTFRHAGRNPSHHTYREVITRPWRAWMAEPPPTASRT
ncbi:DUF7848 domain-containing protein [Streptomyces albireticuli]|uniref:DUF7848 domain-containing protein n=1 Tax=Streptomyces albireticuli TaxID=1940 RepID=A0A2A2DH61_9ACTN|nr:hypothetical protein [Streptomyces albireticuli]MCD9143865.1 hypothetical protein [Streptomyces albireticuli]MCD9161704.1 hypothetical protein [Streptomyces albireticuli]MCD9191982.1 hypothetical protein [Streptomyces albireticuli]PAU50739.1 hypothetical protein CK936_01075 [Streptomyces albireticuli]